MGFLGRLFKKKKKPNDIFKVVITTEKNLSAEKVNDCKAILHMWKSENLLPLMSNFFYVLLLYNRNIEPKFYELPNNIILCK